MKTFVAKEQDVNRQWLLIDAEGQVLGRLASEIARRLRGKDKPIFTPSVDTGDYIIVVNVDKIRMTGNKLQDKIYHHHSRFPGGLKSISAGDQLSGPFPERVLVHAIKGMLPKNILGRQMFRKLKVYSGSSHPHEAQQPVEIKLN